MMDERGFFDALLLAWLCLSLAVFLILSIVRALFAELRRRARQHWEMRAPQCGAVSFIQRFGSALNLNLHFHALALDGVYVDDGTPGAETLGH